MHLDNRNSRRVPVDRQVMLHSNETGNRLLPGRMLDLSHDGMLVETDDAEQLSVTATVRAAFRLDSGIGIVSSTVVRRHQRHLALRFMEHPPETQEAICRILDNYVPVVENRIDYRSYLQPPDWR